METFPNIYRLRMFTIHRPSLKGLLEDVLQQKEKSTQKGNMECRKAILDK